MEIAANRFPMYSLKCSNQKCFAISTFQDQLWGGAFRHYAAQFKLWVSLELLNDFMQKCIAAFKDLFESDWTVEMHYPAGAQNMKWFTFKTSVTLTDKLR